MFETGTDHLAAHVADGVATVIFNRPDKLNAMSADMFTALASLCRTFDADPAVRVIVLRGAGPRAFISGADIGQLAANDEGAGGPGSQAPDAALLPTTKPVVAAIHGFCMGAGVMVALDTDLRIASDDAVFAVPPAKLGVAYPLAGVRRLVQIVGAATATEILVLGNRYTAAEAVELGLVHRVVPRDELDSAVESLCTTLAANAPLSIRAAKASIAAALEPTDDAQRSAQAAIAATWGSNDFLEGRDAFAAKRTPRFTGT